MLFGRHLNVNLSLAKNNSESPKEENTMNKPKIANVKKHFKTNKNAYISGAACLAAGAIGASAFSNPAAVQKAVNQGLLVWKPVQNLEQTTVLVRRGHPGFVIKCMETGELFASQNRAAALNGVDAGTLSKHLSGKIPNACGLHFQRLGEAI